MGKRLAKNVVLRDEKHNLRTFAPGDTLPGWAEALVTNPDVFAAEESPAEESPAEESPAEDQLFDPADHKVEDVISYLENADEDERKRVLDAETAGKARKNILKLGEASDEAEDLLN